MGTVIRLENEMKDSGIDWYGLMPANWEIKPIYASLDEINQKNNPIITTNILASVYKGILHKTTKNGLPTY